MKDGLWRKENQADHVQGFSLVGIISTSGSRGFDHFFPDLRSFIASAL